MGSRFQSSEFVHKGLYISKPRGDENLSIVEEWVRVFKGNILN
jgi:hypothetical protein